MEVEKRKRTEKRKKVTYIMPFQFNLENIDENITTFSFLVGYYSIWLFKDQLILYLAWGGYKMLR